MLLIFDIFFKNSFVKVCLFSLIPFFFFTHLLAEYEIGLIDNPKTRIVLIGGDHKLSLQTLYSPESIQRTEIFEYSKVLGNSQFSLPPFQHLKLIYAYMLAEVGLMDTSKKYFFFLFCFAFSNIYSTF